MGTIVAAILKLTRSAHRSSCGAILPFVAMAIGTIFLLVAWVIDTNIATASKEQAEEYTRLAALSAIESFFQARQNGSSESVSYAAALARSNAVSSVNTMLGDATKSATFADPTNPNAGATLEAGNWGINIVSCGSSTDPCFIPCGFPLSSSCQPNAFRARGKVYPTGLRTQFMRLFHGVDTINYTTSAVASITPRHGCFLVDNSGSITRTTHLAGQDEFAYYLKSINNPAALDSDPDYGLTYQDTLWTALLARGPRPVRPSPATEHFRDDYLAYTTLGTNNGGVNDWNSYTTELASRTPPLDILKLHPDPATSVVYRTIDDRGSTYMVDVYRDTNHTGPEPLSSVFSGLNAALTQFKSRRVAGDKACVIFYDETLAWPRVIKPTAEFDYLLSLTKFGDPAGSDFAQIMRHGLFPGRNGNTNMVMALTEAYSQLAAAREPGIPSTDFVVMIGDGLANCQSCLDLNGNPVTTGSCAAGPGCNNSLEYYQQAIAETNAFVSKPNGFIKNGAALHVIAMGDKIQPHTVDILKPSSSECYTDEEWRASTKLPGADPFGYVDGSDLSLAPTDLAAKFDDPDVPFRAANYELYKMAASSGGTFTPIRPRSATPGGPCTSNTIGCASSAGIASGDLVQTTDGRYARVTDPQCRNEQQQITAAMTKIVGDSPFSIVQVN